MVGEHALRQEALAALTSLVESLLTWYKQASANAASSSSLSVAAVSSEDVDSGKTAASAPLRVLTIDEDPSDASPGPPSLPPSSSSSTGVNQDLAARRAYKARFNECLALFNSKPRRGVEALINEGMLGPSPEEVAAFLAKGQGLDKTMIGDYLGEREDFSLKVGWGGRAVSCWTKLEAPLDAFEIKFEFKPESPPP